MYKNIVFIVIILAFIGGILLYQKSIPSTKHITIANGVAQTNTTDSNNKYDNNLASIKWLQRYPQLKTIPAGSMTATIDKLRTSESISALIGPIDNPYGVRNDILDAILTTVPVDNPKMLQAAIKDAYYENLADFSSSDESKLFYTRKSSLAMHCMIMSDLSENSQYFNRVTDNIGDMMRDTDERAKWGYHLDHDVFAWKTLGTGLASDEEDELCSTGDY